VIYMAFDVLYARGELAIERPLEERRKLLEQIFASVPQGGFMVEYAMATEDAQGKLVFEPGLFAGSGEAGVAGPGTLRVALAPAFPAHSRSTWKRFLPPPAGAGM